VWKKHQRHHPKTAEIVAVGLDKIEAYSARASVVDAYMLAMCPFFSLSFALSDNSISVVNSEMKLNWYRRYKPADVPQIKNKIAAHVCAQLHF
jgi:hypothetical protein